MSRVQSAFVRLLLHALEPPERDVIEGDLKELRLHHSRAIRELLGLLIRRQAAAWLHWQPWAVVLLVILPIGTVLSLVSRQWANNTAIYAWFYVDNWTSAYLASPGARNDFLYAIAEFSVRCVALMLWAWTAGLVVAASSRRTAWVTYALFALVLFAGTIGSTTAGVLNPANDAVFSQAFYRVGLPIVFRIVFILLPALHGMRTAAGEPTFTIPRASALAVSVTLVTAMVARGTPVALTFGWLSSSTDRPVVQAIFRSGKLSLVPYAMALPAIYAFFHALWRSWRERGLLPPDA
jgi:hypothetical protein